MEQENRNGLDSGSDSFEDAAKSVTAAEKPEKSSTESGEIAEDKFVIDEGWAVASVQFIFSPLAKYSHPAWEVTDEEAQLVSPKMQVFLQNLVDRYIPQFLSRFAAKNKELSELAGALAMLYFIKRRQVSRILKVEAAIERAKKDEGKRPLDPDSPFVKDSSGSEDAIP